MIILIALPNLWIFYFIFTPLTIYPVYFLLKPFFEVSLSGNIIEIPNYYISIIKACVAGSAYYLLLILNLSIPKIKLSQRVKMVLFAFVFLLVVNILRIFLLVFFLDYSWFDITHKLFWYSLSTIFVIAIWFAEVKLFKIKQVPFYSDIKFLYHKSFLGR